MPTLPSTTTHALKEWAVAVEALEQGKTILLLRKGGIHERGGLFKVAHNQVLLYPTYEHQKPQLLKPEYAQRVEPVPTGWHPATVRIGAWAEITHIFQVIDAETIAALLPYHIWNSEFVSDRLQWQPNSPLYLLLLRTYKLPQAQSLPFSSKYGGCKSWLDLVEPLALAEAQPVLSEAAYARQVIEIGSLVAMREPEIADPDV